MLVKVGVPRQCGAAHNTSIQAAVLAYVTATPGCTVQHVANYIAANPGNYTITGQLGYMLTTRHKQGYVLLPA